MQIAGTPPIDWSGHSARHAERRSQRDAGAGTVRDRTGRPAIAPAAEETTAAQQASAKPGKPTAEEQIAKLQPRIDHFVNRLGQRLGLDHTALQALKDEITALQGQYVGARLGEEATATEPGAQGSYRAAVAHLIHTWRQAAAEGMVPTEGEEPAGEVDPVAGEIDPAAGEVDSVAGDTGVVDEAGSGETVVIDPPVVTLPVEPPETTDPVELIDVLLTGVPSDE